MWTRELLKNNAKAVLRRTYWRSFLVCLVAGLLTGRLLNLTSRLQADDLHGLLGLLAGLLGLVLGLAALAWSIFGVTALTVGWKRYMMESRLGNSPFDTLFSGFHIGYMNSVKVMVWYGVQVFLYTLLLVVPGIIKSYEYCLVPYLLAENPYLEPRRALELSKLMTDGEKWNIFVLQLSFIGWFILGSLAFGLGNLFVTPYYEAAFAELYAALRAKAFSLGYTDEHELGGFVKHPL